jgi:hypothetical protein
MALDADKHMPVPDGSEVQKKKVRFSPMPEYHSEIPWARQARGSQEKESLTDGDMLYPLQSSFKDSAYIFRAEKEPEDKFSCFGVCTLIVCLVVFFLLIWFVVSKVLLLEIQSQVNNGARVVGNDEFRFLGPVS